MSRTMRIAVAAVAAVALFGAGLGIAVAVTRGTSQTAVYGPYGPMMAGHMMGGGGGYGMMQGGGMMGGWGSTTGSAPSPVAGAREVTVTADDLRFSPSTITVRSGEAVNVTLRNSDEVLHDMTIPMLGIHAVAQPGGSVTFGLQASGAGTYPFFCSVDGHAQAGMRGTLTVTG